MKTLLFFLLCSVASADVHVFNYSAASITADATAIASNASADIAYASTEMYIFTANRTVTVYVLDGSHVFIDDVGVTVTVPLASYLEVVMKGFYAGIAAELLGLMLRVVRATKSRIGEVV